MDRFGQLEMSWTPGVHGGSGEAVVTAWRIRKARGGMHGVVAWAILSIVAAARCSEPA